MHLYEKAKMHVENFAWNKSSSFIFYSILKIINRRISLPQIVFKNNPTHFFDEKFLVRYILPKNQGCFVDVGAHIGVWAFFLAKKGVEVHAFEPSPNPRRILRMKAEKFPDVYVYPYALGEKHYTAELNLHSSSMVDSLVKKSDDFWRQIKVT